MARFKRPHRQLFGKPQILFAVCVTALAQTTETPHDTVLKVKGIGLKADTVDQVEPLLERAVTGWAELNPRSLEYGEALMMLGMVKQFLADLDIQALRTNVEPLYKKALTVYERSLVAPNPADLALILELRAGVLNAIGEVQEATYLSERAIAIRKERVREIQEGAQKFSTAFKPGNGISAPVVSSRAEPVYTNEGQFLRIKGTAGLRVVVDEKGVPQDIALSKSLGYGLDENAVLALRAWRFVPGKDESGKAVPTVINLEISFPPEKQSQP